MTSERPSNEDGVVAGRKRQSKRAIIIATCAGNESGEIPKKLPWVTARLLEPLPSRRTCEWQLTSRIESLDASLARVIDERLRSFDNVSKLPDRTSIGRRIKFFFRRLETGSAASEIILVVRNNSQNAGVGTADLAPSLKRVPLGGGRGDEYRNEEHRRAWMPVCPVGRPRPQTRFRLSIFELTIRSTLCPF